MQTLIVVSKSKPVAFFYFIISNHVRCMEDPVQRIAKNKNACFHVVSRGKSTASGTITNMGGNSPGELSSEGNCPRGELSWGGGGGGNCTGKLSSADNCPGRNCHREAVIRGNSPRGAMVGEIALRGAIIRRRLSSNPCIERLRSLDLIGLYKGVFYGSLKLIQIYLYLRVTDKVILIFFIFQLTCINPRELYNYICFLCIMVHFS